MNIARSSVKLSIAHGLTALITFGGVAVFANLLPPSELGTYFLFEALVGVLAIPADFGIRGAVKKRISEDNAPGQMLSSALLMKLLPMTIIIAGVILFSGFISTYVGSDIAVLVVLGILGSEFYKLGIGILSGELRVGETATIRLTHKAIWFAAGYVFIQYGLGVSGIIYGLLLAYALPFIWAMVKRSTPFRRPSMEQFQSLTAYSKYNFLSSLSGYFYSWMDVLVIGLFLTSSHVGSYEIAWRVTAVVILGSRAIAQTIFPQVSRWDANRAIDRIERLIPRTITPSLLIAIPAFFGTVLLSREILTYVFDPEYATAWLVLIVLMGEKILQSVHVIIGRSLKAIDHPELAAKAAIIAMVVNLVLNLVLIWQFGIIGAAVATVASFGLNTFLCMKYLSRFLRVEIPWREIGWLLLASTGMASILRGVLSIVAIDSLPRLLGIIAFGAVLYGAFVLLSPTLRAQALQSLQMVKSDGTPGEPVQSND